MGIKRRRILRRFQKYKLVLVTNAPKTSKSRLKICFTVLYRRPPCVVKQKLHPGFTRFRAILSPIQVNIFEIYVKFSVFLIPIMKEFEKKFLDPTYVCLIGKSGFAKIR
jgi:hypothetical protein